MNQIYKYVISNKIVASISIIIAVISIIGIVTELIDKQNSLDTYYLVGILMILLVFLRTIISDFYMLFTQQNNTFCDTGQYGTKYDLENFITKRTNDLYIIGQNLRTIISETRNIEAIKKYLNKKNNYLTLILSPYDVLKKVHPLAAEDLILSTKELKNLKNSFDDDIKKRFNIWFHYGTVTLSSMIKNPKDINSVLIFNPKWAYDRTPDNRLYCVIKKNKNPKGFTAIWSGISSMLQSEKISLEEMEKLINK